MSKQKQNQKSQVRKNIICYFLAIAKGQKVIQQLKQQLILHPYFNPILLFKKISHGSPLLQKSDFRNYLNTFLTDFLGLAIETYSKKHDLGSVIQCQEYINTILPYNPDALRNSSATIVWQIKSSPMLKRDIESIYKQLIKVQLYHIINVSYFRNKIQLKWNDIKQLIQKDLKISGTKFQKSNTQFDLVSVRKWVQLWIQIHQKDILYVMRWINGSNQINIQHNFNNIYVKSFRCKCNEKPDDLRPIKMKQSPQKGLKQTFRCISIKRLSKKQQKMLDKKIQFINSKQNSRKDSFANSSFSEKRNTSKQNYTNTNENQDYQKVNYEQIDENREKALDLWYQYLYTLLTGQRIINSKRKYLTDQLQNVIKILNSDILSRDKNNTKIEKVIKFIQKNSKFQMPSKQLIEKYLSKLMISNDVLISIFTVSINKMDAKEKQKQGKILEENMEIKKYISQVLKNYCITKAKLIQISTKIMKQNLGKKIYQTLNEQSRTQIKRQELIKFLSLVRFQYMQEDLCVLMRHFGNGTTINEQSFIRVFRIQSV